MSYVVRPISDQTWFGTMGKEASRFKSKWGSTLELLEREVAALDGRDLVLEVDVTESDLRLDGTIRASARPSSSAVVVAFESKHGPLLYRCDRFYTNWHDQGPEWQHNVRAIALTLEALRAVDRYGATETGQQYAGWKQLPAGSGSTASHMTADEAWSILGSFGDDPIAQQRLAGTTQIQLRKARAFAHPDRHDGDRTLWDQVEQAARVLGALS
jgi:hypothetical protein